MYFEGYGELDWLNAKNYYAEPWTYLETVLGNDGEFYDIVTNIEFPYELRFTII